MTSLGRTSSTGPLRSVLALLPMSTHPWRSSWTWCTSRRTLRLAFSTMDDRGVQSLQSCWCSGQTCTTRHSQSCSGHMTYCLCLLLGGITNVWQSFLGIGICGKPVGLRQYVIELLDHVICILELCIPMEIAFTVASP